MQESTKHTFLQQTLVFSISHDMLYEAVDSQWILQVFWLMQKFCGIILCWSNNIISPKSCFRPNMYIFLKSRGEHFRDDYVLHSLDKPVKKRCNQEFAWFVTITWTLLITLKKNKLFFKKTWNLCVFHYFHFTNDFVCLIFSVFLHL